ncbi:MAG TPA: rhodanese-like domain-containing protein [Bacteroidia bacterium]|nr:rhodanese-like domain-containing protein [Bacteroidia bacterium]
MIQFIKKIFGIGPAVDYPTLMNQGATIVDVRTKNEYQQGHIKGSINIPLNNLDRHLQKIKKDKPVITCCASGMRSASAKSILKSNGFSEVHNGGGWMSLQSRIRK